MHRTRLAFLTPTVLLLSQLTLATLTSLRFGQSLWSDEAISVWFGRYPVATLVARLCDPHPPAYYLLLKVWLVGGEGETWLRSLSLLAALLSLILVYQFGKELCGRRCGLMAVLLLAVHPLQVWYAGEVRMYAWAQLLGVLLAWLGWRLILRLEKPSTLGRYDLPLAASYLIMGTVALFFDYTVLLAFGLVQLLWIARGRPRYRLWLALQVAMLIPFLLWWGVSLQRVAMNHSYQAIFLAVQGQRLGIPLTPQSAAWFLWASLLLLVIAGLGGAWLWPKHFSALYNRPVTRYVLLAAWLALLLFAAWPRLFSLKRLWVVLLPFAALAIALILVRMKWPVTATLVGLSLMLVLLTLPRASREPWRELIAEIDRSDINPAIVWVDDLAAPVLTYYTSQTNVDYLDWAPLMARSLPDLPDLTPPPGDDLWLLLQENPYRQLAASLPAAFRAQYDLLNEKHDTGIVLYQYRRRNQPAQELPAQPSSSPQMLWGLDILSPFDTCSAIP